MEARQVTNHRAWCWSGANRARRADHPAIRFVDAVDTLCSKEGGCACSVGKLFCVTGLPRGSFGPFHPTIGGPRWELGLSLVLLILLKTVTSP